MDVACQPSPSVDHALERARAVAADPDRRQRLGLGREAEILNLVELALEARIVLGPQGLEDPQHLVGLAAARMERRAQHLQLFLPPAHPHPDDQAPLRQRVDGGEHLGHDDRVAMAEHEDGGAQPCAAGAHGGGRQGDHRLQVGLVGRVREAAPGVAPGGRSRENHVIADPQRRHLALLRLPGERLDRLAGGERSLRGQMAADFHGLPLGPPSLYTAPMAFGYLVVAILAAAIATFALQNSDPVTIHFLFWSFRPLPIAGVALACVGHRPDRGRPAAGARAAAVAVAQPRPRDARGHPGEHAGRAGARRADSAPAAPPAGAAAMSTRERRTLIQAGWVIAYDGRGHRLLRDGVVVMEGGRIVHVGPRFDGTVDETVDARDRVLTPGLISTHAHIGGSPLDRSFIEDRGSPQFWYSGLFEIPAGARRRPGRRGHPRLHRLLDGRAAPRRRDDRDGDRRGEADHVAAQAGRFGLRVYMGLPFRSGTLAHPRRPPGRVGVERGGWAARTGPRGGSRGEARRRARRPGALLLLAGPGGHLHARAVAGVQAARRRARGGRTRSHTAQSVVEFNEMLSRHGKTPIAWLSDLGVLGPNTVLGHAIIVGGSSWTNYPAGDVAHHGRRRLLGGPRGLGVRPARHRHGVVRALQGAPA